MGLKDRLKEVSQGNLDVTKKINQDLDKVLTEEVFSDLLEKFATDNNHPGFLSNFDNRLKVFLNITKLFHNNDEVVIEYYLSQCRDSYSCRLTGNTNTYNSDILFDLSKYEVQDRIERHIKDMIEQFEDIRHLEVFNCSGADYPIVTSNGFNLVYEISFTNPVAT